MFTLACVGGAWWAGVNSWMLSVQMLNDCWRAVVVLQCCFVNTLHFVIFFLKCEMTPDFGHSLTFKDGVLALRHHVNSVLNVVVCVHNNSPWKNDPWVKQPHNADDKN